MLHNFNRSLELLDRLETDYIRVFCYDLAQNYNDTYKTYEYSRLCTIIDGEKSISVNQDNQFSNTFTYNKNDFLLLPPNSKINMTMNQSTKAVVFELNNEVIKKVSHQVCNEYLLDNNSILLNNYYLGAKNSDLQEIIKRISSKFLSKDKKSKYIIDLYTQELIYHLLQNKAIYQILNSERNNPVNKAIQFMNDHYDKCVSIQQLSYDLNMSQANFCQQFKKITHMTPNQYLTKIKLERAKKMLKHSSVTDVAFELGYSNISHFIYLFKKMYGITPKQYSLMNQIDWV